MITECKFRLVLLNLVLSPNFGNSFEYSLLNKLKNAFSESIVRNSPTILIVILLQVVLKSPIDKFLMSANAPDFMKGLGVGLISIFFVLGLLYWVDMARIVRGQILALKEQEFVLAAKVLGASNREIISKHLNKFLV